MIRDLIWLPLEGGALYGKIELEESRRAEDGVTRVHTCLCTNCHRLVFASQVLRTEGPNKCPCVCHAIVSSRPWVCNEGLRAVALDIDQCWQKM